MNPVTALEIITTIAQVIKAAVDAGPSIIKGIEDAKPFAEAIFASLVRGKEISQDDLDALEAKITDLSNQLQLPLPPEN